MSILLASSARSERWSMISQLKVSFAQRRKAPQRRKLRKGRLKELVAVLNIENQRTIYPKQVGVDGSHKHDY
jgi:hypothetical protein